MTMTKFSRINKQREEITMRVLEDMEKGGNEWKKPWVEASPLPPHNPVSGTQYSGRNFLYQNEDLHFLQVTRKCLRKEK